MNKAEIDEINLMSKIDGKKLLTALKFFDKLNYIFLILCALCGLLTSIAVASTFNSNFLGVSILIATAIFTSAIYYIQIIFSSTSKILIHILFSNLAILSKKDNHESV